MRRIKEVKITDSFFQNGNEKFRLECSLMQKRVITALDRTLTISSIIINHDSKNGMKVILETLRGEKFIGFNLKNKHIKEIAKILLDETNNEDSKKISNILMKKVKENQNIVYGD